ncbi:MAG: ABC transporter permease, partial [Lentisphaeria bacterium]|nr:ABC transporter permease [Lentisphaeria bacterium]
VTVFDVPVKGSFFVLILASVMYAVIATGMGLLFSSVTRSQIAVIFLAMLGTMIPSVQLCGMTTPVEAQEGIARIIGSIYPTTYMLLISRGVFNKGLDFADLTHSLGALAVMIPVITSAGVLLQKKQEK